MKNIIFLVAFCATSICAAADLKSAARVVRLSYFTNAGVWRFSVNKNAEDLLDSNAATEKLLGLHLGFGDDVLFGDLPFSANKAAEDAWNGMYHCCKTNRAGMYWAKDRGSEIFSIPVYHWVASYDDPRILAEARFFFEGSPLGASTNGYRAMLGKIRADRPRKAFVLGSPHDFTNGLWPGAGPYENDATSLIGLEKECGTRILFYDPMM